ncbi:MAG: PfkB family carbohydrate kinase, partial [Dolichospermum sp.]
VPTIQPVDTLGAGDIFHGAFCHYILENSFVQALELAANTAAKACQYFGTRNWLNAIGHKLR